MLINDFFLFQPSHKALAPQAYIKQLFQSSGLLLLFKDVVVVAQCSGGGRHCRSDFLTIY